MPTTCYIYTLHASSDPTCRPRYVGFTTRPKKREKQHGSNHQRARKGEWARRVIRSGGAIVLKVVHTFFSDDPYERGYVEATWIGFYRRMFSDLLNDKGGGGGLVNCSPESRQNLRTGQLRRYANPEAIEQNRQAILRYYSTPGAKEKSRQAALRRFSRPTEIEKVSRIQKLRYSKPSEIEKNRRAISLMYAKRDLTSPPTEKRLKSRMACIKCKAKQDAKKQGIVFDEIQWFEEYQRLLKSVRAQAFLDTF